MATRCPHCGELDLSDSPLLKQVYDMMADGGGVTARDVAERTAVRITSALAALRDLERLDAVYEARRETGPGRAVVFARNPASLPTLERAVESLRRNAPPPAGDEDEILSRLQAAHAAKQKEAEAAKKGGPVRVGEIVETLDGIEFRD